MHIGRGKDCSCNMDETRTDGDDDDEGGTRSFYFTTGAVKRMHAKEDGSLTATCQVGGHAQCSNIIPMSNGGTQGVAHTSSSITQT
jgi:hypothetical protein